jgi:CBS-domain-containing membrane protein
MKQLKLHNLDQVRGIRQPANDPRVTPRSPATSIFTDFELHVPVTITASAKAVEVESLMQRAHVKLMLVLDTQDHFAGVISLADLSEQRLIRAVANGVPRHEVDVEDLMQPRARLHALSYQDLRQATVQDVVYTLRDERAQHALVIDTETQELRGLVSAADVARRLQLALPLNTVVKFTEVHAALSRQPDLLRYA